MRLVIEVKGSRVRLLRKLLEDAYKRHLTNDNDLRGHFKDDVPEGTKFTASYQTGSRKGYYLFEVDGDGRKAIACVTFEGRRNSFYFGTEYWDNSQLLRLGKVVDLATSTPEVPILYWSPNGDKYLRCRRFNKECR